MCAPALSRALLSSPKGLRHRLKSSLPPPLSSSASFSIQFHPSLIYGTTSSSLSRVSHCRACDAGHSGSFPPLRAMRKHHLGEFIRK